jgi:hypothetical protein
MTISNQILSTLELIVNEANKVNNLSVSKK